MQKLLFYAKIFRYIYSINRANLGYQLEVNYLADRNDLELKALRGKQYTPGYNGGAPFPHDIEKEIADVPDSIDWRLYGAVTPVKGLIMNNIAL